MGSASNKISTRIRDEKFRPETSPIPTSGILYHFLRYFGAMRRPAKSWGTFFARQIRFQVTPIFVKSILDFCWKFLTPHPNSPKKMKC